MQSLFDGKKAQVYLPYSTTKRPFVYVVEDVFRTTPVIAVILVIVIVLSQGLSAVDTVLEGFHWGDLAELGIELVFAYPKVATTFTSPVTTS